MQILMLPCEDTASGLVDKVSGCDVNDTLEKVSVVRLCLPCELMQKRVLTKLLVVS